MRQWWTPGLRLGTSEGSRLKKTTEKADGGQDEEWHIKTRETKRQVTQKQLQKKK